MIRRLLIVEDDIDAGHLLAAGLQAAGFETRVALDGAEGIALAARFHPEAALLDIVLPDIDGYEVARRLRELPSLKGLWIVAVTGLGSAQSREKSQSAGFDMHWVKPVDLDELIEFLRRLPSTPPPP